MIQTGFGKSAQRNKTWEQNLFAKVEDDIDDSDDSDDELFYAFIF